MYLCVRETFAFAADYEPTGEDSIGFSRTIRDDLHFVATGKTAAELIAERAEASRLNMDLTVWKGAVVRKGEVTAPVSYVWQGLRNFWNASEGSRQQRELAHEDAFVLKSAFFGATRTVRKAVTRRGRHS